MCFYFSTFPNTFNFHEGFSFSKKSPANSLAYYEVPEVYNEVIYTKCVKVIKQLRYSNAIKNHWFNEGTTYRFTKMD